MLDGQRQRVDVPIHLKLLKIVSFRKDWKKSYVESLLMSPHDPIDSVEGLK